MTLHEGMKLQLRYPLCALYLGGLAHLAAMHAAYESFDSKAPRRPAFCLVEAEDLVALRKLVDSSLLLCELVLPPPARS